MLVAGSWIGPYQIAGRLGAGGMGEVYRAHDPRLDRWVAVKVLMSSQASTPRAFERFEREARAIARVSHPNVCAVYDVGQDGGVPFLVMELLEGETLAERLVHGPVSLDAAVAIAIQIADALAELHDKGVVHRDLKPSNVMLTGSGVKLLDFGLAKLRDGEFENPIDNATRTLQISGQGTVLGTLPYMAPEQVEGRPADARTDTFALGVVLYEMLTGQAPFQSTSKAGLAAAILTHEPPPLSSLVATTPTSLDRVVAKCLAKEPDERWQNLNDLASALRWSSDDSAADRQPVHFNADAAAVNGASLDRGQHRAVTAFVSGLVAATLIAAAVWAGGLGRGGHRSPDSPRFIPVTFRAGTVTAARFAPDGDTIVYSAAWGGASSELFVTRRDSVESRRLDLPEARLLGVSSAGELAFLRGSQNVLRLLTPVGGTLFRVSITGGGPRELLDDVIAADWAPGGGDLAVVRRRQVEFPLGTTVHGPHRFSYVRIAPDGRRLALVEAPGRDDDGKRVGSAIVVIDRSGRKTTLSSGWGDMTTLAWAPSGDEVWFTANRPDDFASSALRAVSMDGRERVILPGTSNFLSIHDVLPNGRVLLSSTVARMGCSCLTPGDSQPRDLGWLDGPAPEALSADGRTVLMAEMLRGRGAAGSIYLRGTDGSTAVRLGDGFPEDLSPDGKWVLAAPAGTRDRWFILPIGTGGPRALPPGPIVERFEANFLPDGRGIVFAGREKDRARRIYVQDIDSGVVRAISPEESSTVGVATPDGKFVIGASPAGRRLYPVEGGEPVPFPIMAPDDTALQWSADGRLLYVWRTTAWPPVVDRIEASTGHREAWKTIQPADPAGLDAIFRIVVTPDGKTYCHDYVRFLSDLFVVEGLQ